VDSTLLPVPGAGHRRPCSSGWIGGAVRKFRMTCVLTAIMVLCSGICCPRNERDLAKFTCRRLKGPGRPVNPLERRMTVLAGLEAVDWVVGFAEDTPEPLLARVRPDVLVKGGDYSDDEVVGAGYVRDYGGEVRVLSHIDACSTTAIVRRLQG